MAVIIKQQPTEKVTVILNKDHRHAGKLVEKGEKIEVSEQKASGLEERKIGYRENRPDIDSVLESEKLSDQSDTDED